MSSNGVNPYIIKNQQQLNFAAAQQNPAMQGQAADAIQQSAGNSYLANRAKASQDANPLTTLGLTAGIGYGIGQGMDYFNPKCAGAYETSILGKLGTWGDKFSTKTYVGRFIESGLQKISTAFNNLTGKSKIAYSLKHHSTRPEWSLVRVTGNGVAGFLAADTENVFQQFLEPIAAKERTFLGFIPRKAVNEFQKLEQYGLKQAEIDSFVSSLAGKSFEQKAMALQKKELELLGVDVKGIASKTLEELRALAKEAKAKKLGFASLADMESIAGKYMDNPDKIIAALEKAAKNDFSISINRAHGFWGKIKSHFLGRTVSMSEYLNKYKAALGKGNSTYIGRLLPKATAWLTEGCTNRYAGGKLAPFMQAAIFADMVYHTYKAPKGEKGKTFIERFVNDFTYFIGAAFGVMGLHKVGGFKYIGVDEAGREAYRAALKLHNENVLARAFASKKECKESLKAVNSLLKTDGLNFFQKALQKIGKFVNLGNEHAFAYRSNASVNLNWLRRIANTNIIGVPFRVWAVMAVITPFLAKATTKCVHAIFGKPTHSVLDEDEETEEVNPQQDPSFNGQQQARPNVTPVDTTLNPGQYEDTNLIKQAANGQKITSQTTTQTVNPNGTTTSVTTTTITNPAPQDNKELEPKRTYIPSPEPMVQKAPDMSALDAALAQADNAEKEIQQILAGNKGLSI